MLNRNPIPEDIVKQLFRNASTLQRYSEQSNRIRVLCTACAVIRKFHNDRAQKEEWTMGLEERKDDRSYQFGRLLAVMEHVERTTYGPEEDREPNAIRLQSECLYVIRRGRVVCRTVPARRTLEFEGRQENIDFRLTAENL